MRSTSSASSVAHSLVAHDPTSDFLRMQRNQNEIERLRLKMMTLEQQLPPIAIGGGNMSSMTVGNMSALTTIGDHRLRDIEYEAKLLRAQQEQSRHIASLEAQLK